MIFWDYMYHAIDVGMLGMVMVGVIRGCRHSWSVVCIIDLVGEEHWPNLLLHKREDTFSSGETNQEEDIDVITDESRRMIKDCRFSSRNHPVNMCPALGKSTRKAEREITLPMTQMKPSLFWCYHSNWLKIWWQWQGHHMSIDDLMLSCLVDTVSSISTLPLDLVKKSKLLIKK